MSVLQRYELVAGTSAKFWAAGVDGSTLSVRFGRIGTQGQSQDKRFPDATTAQKELDKLVEEKTSKGERTVRTGPAAAEPPHRSPSAPAPASPAPRAAAPRPTVASQGPAPIFAGAALLSRMRPGPPLDPAADWAAFTTGMRPLLRQIRARVQDLAADLES